MKEKKFRTFLIVFSIMMSSALFFASGAMSGSVEEIIIERIRSTVGNSEITVYPNQKSPYPYVTTSGAERFNDDMDFIVGTVGGSAIYKQSLKESVRLNLHGYKLEELQKLNPVYIEQDYNISPFIGKKLVISSTAAEKLGLKPGDNMDLEIAGNMHKFTIAGVALPKGLFLEDGRNVNVLVPIETLASLYNMRGRVSMIYMKPKDLSRKQELIESLSQVYRRYDVVESIPVDDIRRESSSFTVPFMMMVLMVMLISIFIIYTSFRVITTEMLPIIGTFRSVGATKRVTDMVLILESISYGVVGGFLGCGLGIGALRLMISMILTAEDRAAGFNAYISYTPEQMIGAFVVAVLLSVLSSIIPIIKVSKTSVKDIVLNKIEDIRRAGTWKPVLGILLLGFSLIIPRVISRELAIIFDMISLICSSISVILLIPCITAGFIRVFESIYVYVFGNEGVLAAKNLRENKNMLNNISLLAMGISTLLIINTISFSVFKEVANTYRSFKYDIEMSIGGADRQRLKQVAKIDGVSEVYGNNVLYGIEVAGSKNRIGSIFGVDSSKFLNFYDFGIIGDAEKLVRQLDEDRNILISNALKYKLDADIGDSIVLKTNIGERAYRVIGLCETLMNNGQLAMISSKYIKSDFDQKCYNEINIKTDIDPGLVKENIKDYYKGKGIYIKTTEEMKKANNESNAALFSIFKLFSIMAMVIGIFGVVNNFAISFIERKQSLAMLRAAGMSKLQIVKMIFIEALSGGLVGGSVGALTGVISISIIPYLLKAIDLPITMHYSAQLIVNSIIGGAAVTLIASVSPALKTSRLNIIEAIKYE